MSVPLRIALITCDSLPELFAEEVELPARFRARGVDVDVVSWSAPSIDWTGYDLCVIRSTWDYFERVDQFRAWLDRMERDQAPLQNSAALIRWNMDKLYLRELAERGVRTVPTRYFERGQRASIQDVLREPGWEEAVVKPTISGGAYRTSRVRLTDAAAAQSALDALVEDVGALVQPFVSEIQTEGEWSLFYFGGRFSHAVIKVPDKADYRVQPQYGGRAHRVTPDPKMLEDAERIIQLAPEPPLYARVDGVRAGGEFLLMELEAIEPYLFLGCAPEATARYVDVIIDCANEGRASATRGRVSAP